MNIGVGARAMSMSNAVVANVSDVTASYWNPAGLLKIKDRYQFSLMHSEYFGGVAGYDYAGFAMPFDSLSHIGISIIRFGIDDIPDTRFLYDANGSVNYDNIRFFSAADYGFLFSYARKLPVLGGIDVGTSFKVIHRKVGQFASAWGFGLDLGAQKTFGKWQVGCTIRDITGTFNAWSHNTEMIEDIYTQTGNQIPESSLELTLPRILLGVSRDFTFGEKFGLNANVDTEITFDGKRNVLIKTNVFSISPSAGIEADYAKVAFLRVGFGRFQQVKNFDSSTRLTFQPNFGLGVKIKTLNIDYAMTDFSDSSEALYSHVFSLMLSLNDFGKKHDN